MTIPSEVSKEIIADEEKFDSLNFVKLKIPRLIPPALIEAVKGRTFSTDQFYAYQEANIENPFNYLFALIDEHKKIHGFLWAEANLLDHSLFVNTFSISKEYWGKGRRMKEGL